jgi:hypothetical protein
MVCLVDTDELYYCIGGRTGIGIRAASAEHGGTPFDQYRAGLHHLCLRARSTADVDAVARFVAEAGGTLVHPPQVDAWAPGYYSVLFEDPCGTRLEVNYVPGKGISKSRAHAAAGWHPTTPERPMRRAAPLQPVRVLRNVAERRAPRYDRQYEHGGEDDAGDDEMQRFTAFEVAFAVRASGRRTPRLRCCRRLPERQRFFVIGSVLCRGHRRALLPHQVGSFSSASTNSLRRSVSSSR